MTGERARTRTQLLLVLFQAPKQMERVMSSLEQNEAGCSFPRSERAKTHSFQFQLS